MARDPGSLWSPLKENGRQGSYTKTQFIVHSTGDRGTAAAIFDFFNRNDVVVESTFVVGRGPEDPTRQLLDSAQTADANLTANQRGIAVEVVGTEFDDYTDWQVSEIIRLGRWAKATHPIQPRTCPAHNASGFGWHVMFGAPGPWTPVAKACPGRLRIQRLQDRVFPAIFDVQEDDMFNEQDRAWLKEAKERLRGDETRNYDMLQSIEAVASRIEAAVAKLSLGGVDTAEVAKAVKSEIAADLTD